MEPISTIRRRMLSALTVAFTFVLGVPGLLLSFHALKEGRIDQHLILAVLSLSLAWACKKSVSRLTPGWPAWMSGASNGSTKE